MQREKFRLEKVVFGIVLLLTLASVEIESVIRQIDVFRVPPRLLDRLVQIASVDHFAVIHEVLKVIRVPALSGLANHGPTAQRLMNIGVEGDAGTIGTRKYSPWPSETYKKRKAFAKKGTFLLVVKTMRQVAGSIQIYVTWKESYLGSSVHHHHCLILVKPLGAIGAQPAGEYYSMQFTNWPPLPANVLGLETVEIAPGLFLLNDLDVNYSELNELANLMAGVPDPPEGGGGTNGAGIPGVSTATLIPLTPILTSGCSVGLMPLQYQVTNVVLTITNLGGISEFDIFTAPNLNPPVWRWLARLTGGQTTFIVSNPPPNESYYMAACTNALQQWLVGSIVITNSPDRVTIWPDQSGNTNNAAVTSANTRPVWVTNAINGLPLVRFYGTNYFATNLSSLITNWTEAEAFVVLKVATNKPATDRYLWKIGDSGNGTAYPDRHGEIKDHFASTFGSATVHFNVGSTSQGLTNFHLYNPMSRNGEWVARLNGVIKYRYFSNSVGFITNATLGSGLNNFDGDIAEVLMYNRVLTATERQSVNQYLQARYHFMSPPGPPTNLTANVLSPGQISVWWNPATNNEQTVYTVERSTNGSSFTVAAQIEGASFIDSGLLTNTVYYYRVKAANIAAESGYTTTITATTAVSGVDLPLDPSMLQLWLKADVGALANYDGTLDCWLDSSGNTNLATYALNPDTAYVFRPFWLPASTNLNGHPVVRFYRTNFLELWLQNHITNWTAAEAFVVLRATSATNASNPGLWRMGAQNSIYPSNVGTIQEPFFNQIPVTITGLGNAIASPHLYNPCSSTNEWSARINGITVFTRSNNTMGYYSNSNPYLGQANNGFDGDIIECLFYNQVLNANQRSPVTNYFRRKYNLW